MSGEDLHTSSLYKIFSLLTISIISSTHEGAYLGDRTVKNPVHECHEKAQDFENEAYKNHPRMSITEENICDIHRILKGDAE